MHTLEKERKALELNKPTNESKQKLIEVSREILFQKYLGYHNTKPAISSPRIHMEKLPINQAGLLALAKGIVEKTGLNLEISRKAPNVLYLSNDLQDGLRIKLKSNCISIKPNSNVYRDEVRRAIVKKQVEHNNNYKAYGGGSLALAIERSLHVWNTAKRDLETIKEEMGLDTLNDPYKHTTGL